MEFNGTIFLNGEAEVFVTNEFDLSSRWFTYYEDDVDLESFWNIGEGQQYWYRVEGICSKITCDNMGVEVDIGCENDFLFLTVVSARNLKELCETLKRPTINAPARIKINSVKRYTRPVIKNQNNIDDCNVLIEQKICHIPECFDFCVDNDLNILFSFETKATRIFNPSVEIKNINLVGNFKVFRNWYKDFEPEIKNINLNSTSNFSISRRNFNSFGDVEISSDFEYLSNFYFGKTDGVINLDGYSNTISPSYNYVPNDVFVMLGLGYDSIKKDLEINCNFLIKGSADVLLSYNGFGNFELKSFNEIVSPSYNYSSNGFVYLESFTRSNTINEGAFSFNFNFRTEVSDFYVEFLESIQSTNLTINQDIAIVPCACTDLPLFLSLNHGLSNANILKDFISRNSFALPDNFIIRYKLKNKSWQFVKHFNGFGTDGKLKEQWLINFDLCCFEDIGDSYWKFLMSVKRIINNNEDFETKFLLDIPNDISCVDNSLNLNIKYDSFYEEFYVNNILLSSVLYYDEIGLFKSKFWRNRPNFNIRIGPQTEYNPDPTIDLTPIFTT
jgi:hypothetical protein